jgi:transcription antitermination factor NusB
LSENFLPILSKLFAYSFQSELPLSPPAQAIADLFDQIDPLISQSAPERPLDKINRLDLAILREATWEMLHAVPPVPPKVVIDEAIEISKTYASEKSPQFINGVLAAIAESQKLSLKTIS